MSSSTQQVVIARRTTRASWVVEREWREAAGRVVEREEVAFPRKVVLAKSLPAHLRPYAVMAKVNCRVSEGAMLGHCSVWRCCCFQGGVETNSVTGEIMLGWNLVSP